MELISQAPRNKTIGDNLIIAWSKINSPKYEKIICSISGGSDSDIVLDICHRCDVNKKVDYVWFDTGLEYNATKEHLKWLEQKYGIEIKRCKAIKAIPLSCRHYGQPFLSKRVSNYINRLQQHGFDWVDAPLEELLKKYCKWNDKKNDWVGCKSALMWWCNVYGDKSRLNIQYHKWLKEFLIENPPQFLISDKCCKYAKKDAFKDCIKNKKYELSIIGVRKSEGGVRSIVYKNCFDEKAEGYDEYRPVFWYNNSDKEDYEEHYKIQHSRCYTEYGLKRTGCAGCPFGRNFEQELEVIEKFEPKLFIAVNNIFKDSYEYTRKYREFCKKMNGLVAKQS